jgi:hypothetical protein
MFVVEKQAGTIRDATGNVVVTTDPDGSMRDASGKVLLFGWEPFVNDICIGGHCFVCGVSPKDAEFNNEHIIPQWILDFTKQFSGSIRLPNQTLFSNYGGYTIPCCVACNTSLSAAYETVLAPLFRGGYKTLRPFLEAVGHVVIFRWLALMYLKTHLRDARLAWERDRRKKINAKIGDLYDWEALHHVHCIARSHYTGINFDTRRIGSMLILKADTKVRRTFDYAANYFARTVMIQVGEIVCYAVLNDASIVQAHFPRAWKLVKDGTSLTPWQIRELHCEFTWRSWCLKTRPQFATIPIPQPHFQTVMPPYVEFSPKPEALPDTGMTYGELLHYACRDFLEALPEEQRAEAEQKVLSGTATWFKDDVQYWPVSKPENKRPARRARGKRTASEKTSKTASPARSTRKAKSTKPTAKRATQRQAKRAASKRKTRDR